MYYLHISDITMRVLQIVCSLLSVHFIFNRCSLTPVCNYNLRCRRHRYFHSRIVSEYYIAYYFLSLNFLTILVRIDKRRWKKLPYAQMTLGKKQKIANGFSKSERRQDKCAHTHTNTHTKSWSASNVWLPLPHKMWFKPGMFRSLRIYYVNNDDNSNNNNNERARVFVCSVAEGAA